MEATAVQQKHQGNIFMSNHQYIFTLLYTLFLSLSLFLFIINHPKLQPPTPLPHTIHRIANKSIYYPPNTIHTNSNSPILLTVFKFSYVHNIVHGQFCYFKISLDNQSTNPSNNNINNHPTQSNNNVTTVFLALILYTYLYINIFT